MPLPHETIFEFYEGNDEGLYTDATGINFNLAPNQLLENDLALQAQIDNFSSGAGVNVTDDQSGALYNGALWMIDTTTVTPEALLDDWTEETPGGAVVTPNPFTERKYHASAFFAGKHWVFGGEASGGTLAETWSSPDAIDWTLESSASDFGPRMFHQVIIFDDGGGDDLYLIGGVGNNTRDHEATNDNVGNEVWRSSDGLSWTLISDTEDFTEQGDNDSYGQFAICVFDTGGGDEIFLFGGGAVQHNNTIEGERITNKRNGLGWRSSDGVSWTQFDASGGEWTDFSAGSAVVHAGFIYLIGGFNNSSQNQTNDRNRIVRRSNNATSWTQMDSEQGFQPPIKAEGSFNSQLIQPACWSAGGDLFVYHNKVTWRSSDDGVSWDILSYNSDTNLGHPQSAQFDGSHYWLYGGLSIGRGSSNQVWKTDDGVNWLKVDGLGQSHPTLPMAPAEDRQILSDGAKMWIYTMGEIDDNDFSNYDLPDDGGDNENTNDDKRHKHRYKNSVYTTTDGITYIYKGFHTITSITSDQGIGGNMDRAPRFADKFYYFNGKIRYLGISEGNNLDAMSAADGLDFSQDESSVAGNMAWGFSLAELGGEIYIINGSSNDRERNANNATPNVVKSADGDSWSLVAQTSGISDPINLGAATVFDDGGGDKIFITGGFDGEADDAVWSSPDGSEWTQRANLPTQVTTFVSPILTTHNGRMYLIGGEGVGLDANSDMLSEVYSTSDGTNWTLDLAEDGSGLKNPVLRGFTGGGIQFFNGLHYLVVGKSETDPAGLVANTNFIYVSPNLVTYEELTSPLASGSWEERSGHAMFTFGGSQYIHGGFDADDNLLGDMWKSSNGVAWSKVTQFYPPGTEETWARHQIVEFGGELFMLGGRFGLDPGEYHTDILKSTDGITWTNEGTGNIEEPFGRDRHRVVEFGGDLYSTGGHRRTGDLIRVYDDVWTSSDGVTWTEITQLAGYTQMHSHVMLVADVGSGDELFMVAGDGATGKVYKSSDAATWTIETADLGVGNRWGHIGWFSDGRIWIFGGSQSGVIKDDTWSSADGIVWRQDVLTTKPQPRYDHVSFFGDLDGADKIWVFGGRETLQANTFNDIWTTEIVLAAPAYGRNTPPSPNDNDVIRWKDDTANLGVTPAFIGYNGVDDIEGASANYPITVNNESGSLVFTSGKGWRLFDNN